MAYYTDGITILAVVPTGMGAVLRASTTHTTKEVQVYVSGRLSRAVYPISGVAEFDLPAVSATDVFMLLNVDIGEGDTDYFDDAFPLATSSGNRIVFTATRLRGQGVGASWRVYRGDAGVATADTLVHEEPYYATSEAAGGFGRDFGTAFGYGPSVGFGFGFGYDFGFGVDTFVWQTETLPPGVYKTKLTVVDRYGNESAGSTETITLTTYPRPATSLAVTSYTKGTDTLVLGWTASPDIT